MLIAATDRHTNPSGKKREFNALCHDGLMEKFKANLLLFPSILLAEFNFLAVYFKNTVKRLEALKNCQHKLSLKFQT